MAKEIISRRQKIIGLKGLILLIVLIYMIMAISTDLYIPALPLLTQVFEAPRALVNMTMSMFYLFMSIGLLLSGSISDKYGRKPPLLAGAIIYALSNLTCVFTNDIYVLISCRAIQGLSAGICMSIIVAIIKDCFYGKVRDKVLALMQTTIVIAAFLSPLLGAFILKHGNWQILFVVPVLFSIAFIILIILYSETLLTKNRLKGNVFKAWLRLFVVCKNVKFTLMLLTFSIFTIPLMAYVSLASYIYVDIFGLTKQSFSAFYSVTALISVIGPLFYVYLLNKCSQKTMVHITFISVILYSILMLCFGFKSYFIFFLVSIPIPMLFRFAKPLVTSILLKQQNQDTGTVSSLINAFSRFFGSIGIFLASIPFFTLTYRLGTIILLCGVIGLILWLIILKSFKTIPGIK